MNTNQENRVKYVIVDSVAFMKRTKLETIGENFVTTADVINEIRDKQTRHYIQSLPYPIKIAIPNQEYINFVVEIAKKTGDFTVLSNTDIHLMALAYQFHTEFVGKPVHLEVKSIEPILPKAYSFLKEYNKNESDDENKESNDAKQNEVNDETTYIENDEIPSDDDWITAANFEEKAIHEFGLRGVKIDDQVPLSKCTKSSESSDLIDKKLGIPIPLVACLTSDFAMQNVLIHAGISLLSVHGMVIKRPQTYVLWCSACSRPTKKKDIYFCPICGHKGLRRIPVTLHEDGRLEYHFAKKFFPNLRGTKQPIRNPRGGKHADEPIYCADQHLPDRRPKKMKNPGVMLFGATNGYLDDDDVESGANGGGLVNGLLSDSFTLQACLESAFPLHDVASRAACCGIRSDRQIPAAHGALPSNAAGGALHGLRPSRGYAHLPRPKTGNRKKRVK